MVDLVDIAYSFTPAVLQLGCQIPSCRGCRHDRGHSCSSHAYSSWTLPILLPVWWSMTHAMMVAASVHVLEEKRPVLTRQAWLGIAMGWIFWSVMLFLLVSGRGLDIWPESLPWWGPIWPAMAMLLFVVFARWKIMTAESLRSGAEKLKRYGAMWQALYAATWFLAIGLYTQAACFGVLACTGIIVMTILREVQGLSGRPLGYR